MAYKAIISPEGVVAEGAFFLEEYSEIAKRLSPEDEYPFWRLLDLGYVFVSGQDAECDKKPTDAQIKALRMRGIDSVKDFMSYQFHSI